MIKIITHTALCISYVFLIFISNQQFVPIYIWFLPIILFIGINIWGASSISSNYHIKTFCSNSTKTDVLLTFDDGPHSSFTEKILDILKENNIKALFFVVGKNIVGNEHILKRIHQEGHILGNHTYSHSYFFDLFLAKKVESELQETTNLIYKTVGQKPRLFRPPYGVTNPFIAFAVKKLKLQTIGWNIRTLDTLKFNESTFFNRFDKLIAQKGGIILLHDNRESTVHYLNVLIQKVKAKNYHFRTPQEYLNQPVYE